MKVGIICEGRLGGEDAQVFEHFAKRIVPQAVDVRFPEGRVRRRGRFGHGLRAPG